MKKIGINSLILLLVCSMIPMPSIDSVSAESEEEETEDIVLFAEEEGDDINLYLSEENVEADESEIDIPDESEALLIHNNSTFEYENQLYVYIQYEDEDSEDNTDQIVEGYVDAGRVVLADDVEEFLEERQQKEDEETNTETSADSKDNEIENENDKDKDDENVQSVENPDKKEKEDSKNRENDGNEKEEDEVDSNKEFDKESEAKKDVKSKNSKERSGGKTYEGIAKKETTRIRTEPSTTSKTLTTHPIGTVLTYKSYSTNWYEIEVEINNRKQIGYIHKKHVENAKKDSVKSFGLVEKNPTNIRSRASTKADVLTTVPVNSFIEYETFTKYWHKVKITKNGQEKTGYIHKNHISDAKDEQLNGVAAKEKTNIRSSPSTKSEILKQYKIGTVLTYKIYNKNWYEIEVEVNNKKKIGFVHKKHVKNGVLNQEKLRGIAQKNKTNIRTNASTKSEVMSSVPIGTVLDYKTFSDNWYEITLTVGGKEKTGYIHKKHVQNIKSTNKKFEGITLKSPTRVREGASTKSPTLKTYPIGSVLNYKSISKYWYEVSVQVNGKDKTGYIHVNHVENAKSPSEKSFGVALKSPTSVRSRASTKSEIITTIDHNSIIEYETFTKYWYKVSVTIDGKKRNGYIHKNHISDVMGKKLRGIAAKNKTNIRSEPSTQSKILTHFIRGTILEYKIYNKNWFEIKVKVNNKNQTGYIHKKHVENAIVNQEELRGIAQKNKTNIRSSPSTKSNKITSVPIGSILEYKTFSSNWYEISIKVNGSMKTGYVHKKHVETAISNPESIKGVAVKSKTYIRTGASTKSAALTTVPKGEVLNLKTFSKYWYEVEIKVNGKNQVGYVHKKHAGPNKKVVYLDAGHGGSDPGAVSNGLQEKDITLDVAKRVEKKLKSLGYVVIMSRTTDNYKTLSKRTNEANKVNADIFVSVHVNSGGGTGIETYKMDAGPQASKSTALAQYLQNEMINETNARSRGVKDKNLHVNRESNMPSSLVEIGFIDHTNDASQLKKSSYKDKISQGIVNGIKKFFGHN